MKKLILLLSICLLGFLNPLLAEGGLFDYLKIKNVFPSENALIIFYREDCPHCENMDAILKADPAFVKLLTLHFQVQVVDIRTEEGRALADKFNIHSVPTMINYDAGRASQQVIKGFPGINKLAAQLDLDYQVAVDKPNTFIASNLSACGDGIKEGAEQCDDGNTVSGDGCSSSCGVEPGFICSGSPSVCTTICGDGIKAGAESCDDGNSFSGDGCSNACSIEPGYFCTGSPSVCSTVCGDGIKAGTESCDDGNTVSGDGCNSTCTVESGYVCTGSPSVCVSSLPPNNDCAGAISLPGVTGNVSGNNSSATNSSVSGPSCQGGWQKDLWYKFTLTASRGVTLYVSSGTLIDGILAVYSGNCGALTQVGCDDDSGPGTNPYLTGTFAAGTYYVRLAGFSNPNGVGSFVLNYNLNGICGNGNVEYGEECDDGNINSNDGCSYSCTFENVSGAKGIAINEDGTRPNPATLLDIKSDNKAVLLPRMTTTQRLAITGLTKGMVVFDVTTNSFWFYKGSAWSEIGLGSPVGFNAYNATTQTFTTTFAPSLPTELYDEQGNFASNTFTAPVTAVYNLEAYTTLNLSGITATTVLTLSLFNTSTSAIYSESSVVVPTGFAGLVRINTAISTKLPLSTTVGLRLITSSTLSSQQMNNVTFSGFKVY